MATFVHITSEDIAKRVKRSGIRANKRDDGVFAMPVTLNFQVSHQWLREMKQWRRQLMCLLSDP